MSDQLATVAASDYRRDILESLTEKPRTPTSIGEETGIELPHVSRSLNELREVECVELLVPEDTRKGRVYGITESGADVLEALAGYA